MRNNQDRLGGAHTPQSDVPQTEGGGLSFVVPTEHVELPSKGLYYSPDHPLHGKETVEIRFMTAKDEDTLTSKNLIKKGVVIDKLIADLVTDKQIRTESLLIGDRNAIIVAARISGYGADYDTKVNCPSCAKAQEYSFDLQTPSVNYALDEEALENLGITQTEDGLMHYVLPMSKFKISFKLPTGREEKMLVDKLTSKTIVQNETNATTNMYEYTGLTSRPFPTTTTTTSTTTTTTITTTTTTTTTSTTRMRPTPEPRVFQGLLIIEKACT